MKTTILPVFAALSLAVTPAAFASDKFEVEFDYSPVEVASENGAEQVYADLEALIEEQCEPDGSAFEKMRQQTATRICVERTINDAVAQLEEPEVTKVHEAKRG